MSNIAYVGPDHRIHIASQDGIGQRPLTEEGISATWPGWSPDGTSVSYSTFRSGNNGHSSLSIFVSDIEGNASRRVYANDAGTDAIAQGTPHYSLWSPDGTKLASVAQTWNGGLTLFINSAIEPDVPNRILDGGPLFISWSPDSKYLVAHAHQLHYLINVAENETSQIPVMSSQYMTPSWSPIANEMAIFGEISDDTQALLVADTEGGEARMLAEIEGAASISWSPDGQKIALARDLNRRAGYYGSLSLVNSDDSGLEQILNDPVLSFFWSPDGKSIAYITTSEGSDGSIRWAVLNLDSSHITYLSDFRPSQEQLTTFMFFDQYGQSHSPWTADSRHLLFAGVLGTENVRTQLPGRDATGIYLVDANDSNPPREIAQGFLGTCSPK